MAVPAIGKETRGVALRAALDVFDGVVGDASGDKLGSYDRAKIDVRTAPGAALHGGSFGCASGELLGDILADFEAADLDVRPDSGDPFAAMSTHLSQTGYCGGYDVARCALPTAVDSLDDAAGSIADQQGNAIRYFDAGCNFGRRGDDDVGLPREDVAAVLLAVHDHDLPSVHLADPIEMRGVDSEHASGRIQIGESVRARR